MSELQIGPWERHMIGLTREQFRNFNLTGWPDEILVKRESVDRLTMLLKVYYNLYKHTPELYAPNLTPEEVFRRGFVQQLARFGHQVRGDETMEEMRSTVRALRRRVAAVKSFQEAKEVLDDKLIKVWTDEVTEFLKGMNFD